MLLTQEYLKRLKRVSVSTDTNKTKERFKQDFSTTTSDNKNKIEELSGQTRATIYRVYKHGTANARLVLAMSQILNVSPFYYTGEEDEKTPLTDELIGKFLNQYGYWKIVEELKKTADNIVQKNDGEVEIAIEDTIEDPQKTINSATSEESPEQEASDCVPEMQEDEDCSQPTPDDSGEMNTAETPELVIADSVKETDISVELTEDDAIVLLKALFVRARSSGDAARQLGIIKKHLIS